jgi:hypothetical protein
MGRLERFPTGWILLLVAAFLLAACGDPTRRSEIGPTIDALSFEPPARPRGAAEEGPRAGGPPARPRPEVFLARGAAALAPRPPGVQRTPDGVQINLDGADVKEAVRVVLLSTTEGEDKPLKYPATFATADAVILTKMDLAEPVGFDRVSAEANIRAVNPLAPIIATSARSAAGLQE